jgi:hypothetical protein
MPVIPRPEGFPDDMPWEPMGYEQFQYWLLGVRNHADMIVMAGAMGAPEKDIAEHRAILHAAEVALGILRRGYQPRSEAVDDLRAMLDWIDDKNPAWTD